jgi:hypothetical protein
VAGSNANPPVEVTINRINTDENNLQNDFEAAAQDTTTIDYNTIFSPFPTGQTGSGDRRNPFNVWNQSY